ncbi:response regulator [Ramlibacter sp. XY19]|uniref:response regulator n=1 Tax=Ramlibacter paludis TaxID=2908000 RepID=UPI0023DACE54|nr:response regulator [Ramlibacter paludis]MCG2594454.1 response regulator [Ramlibacter paludis]
MVVPMQLVLVVEDEYGNAEILQLLLESAGYRIAIASNGKAALELLEGEKPALILSDFMMPTMNGGEFGHAVRRNSALAQIPFVFMSATSEDVVRDVFPDYDAFLPKPFRMEALLPLVERFTASGRTPAPSSEEVGESVRQLLKSMQLPPEQ